MNKKMLLGTIFGVLSLVFFSHFISSPTFADNPVDIEIIEVIDENTGEPWHDITGAMPGDNYDAIPRIINNGDTAANIRVCLTRSGHNNQGEPLVVTDKHIVINLEPGWTKEPDSDCYQYNQMLPPGALTDPLFRSIAINNLSNEYQNSTFDLYIHAEATTNAASNPDTGANSISEFFSTPVPYFVILLIVITTGIIISKHRTHP